MKTHRDRAEEAHKYWKYQKPLFQLNKLEAEAEMNFDLFESNVSDPEQLKDK